VSNATTGVNAVLRSRRFDPGDEILVFDQTYSACAQAAAYVAERDDAAVRCVSLPHRYDRPEACVDAVVEAVTPRVELALVDHVFSDTGIIAPVAEITEALQSRHIDVLIDGAHALGMIDLDVAEIGPEYYAGNCHKWLCAPKGAGFVWVDGHHRDEVHPTTISNGYGDPPEGRSQFHAEFDWQGTMDPTPWLCVPTAIEFLGSLLPEGWIGLRERNSQLAVEARDILCEALEVDPLVPDEMSGAMAAVPLPDEVFERGVDQQPFDPRGLERELAREHGLVPAVKEFGDKPQRLLRASCQLYNYREQYERLAEVLAARMH
jgi:isopenicillin-N epimerase